MKQQHLKLLLSHFDLGFPKETPQRVYGGLLHTMWRIETTDGIYAVKQLSKNIDLNDERILNHYNLTEDIAHRFINQGISAIGALKKSQQYVYRIENDGFLVYPWVNAKALGENDDLSPHAIKIAEILSKMHLMNLTVEKISEPEFNIHANNKIIALATQAKEAACPFTLILNEKLEYLLQKNSDYEKAVSILRNHTVVSHGDLDQKNVLWDDRDNPVLIDWESARKLNPTYEIINAALDWSGITTEFNTSTFEKMIGAYRNAGGIIEEETVEAAFDGVFGNWINWMVYNIERACSADDLEQKRMGIEQVKMVLSTLLCLKDLIPKIKILK